MRAAPGAAVLAVAGIAPLAIVEAEVQVVPPAAPCDASATRIVERFSQFFFIEKKPHEAFMRWLAPEYIQHDPMAIDGRAAAIAAREPVFAANPALTVEARRLFGDASHVAVHNHSRMKPGDRGFAAVDMVRVKDCRIVEHWDVIQPMPETSANPHPMF